MNSNDGEEVHFSPKTPPIVELYFLQACIANKLERSREIINGMVAPKDRIPEMKDRRHGDRRAWLATRPNTGRREASKDRRKAMKHLPMDNKQLGALVDGLLSAGVTAVVLCKRFKISQIEDLPVAQHAEAVEWLRSMKSPRRACQSRPTGPPRHR